MLGLPLAFSAPLVLGALAALPVLYYLLRVTPPPPRRTPLPTLPIVKDLVVEERQPLRTPWWLLALRLLLVGSAILALAGPRWNPPANDLVQGRGPLVLLIDSGWTSAFDWTKRRDRAIGLLDPGASRVVALRATGDEAQELQPVSASAAIERLRAIQPVPFTPDRRRHFDRIRAFVAVNPDSEVLWVTDKVRVGAVDEGVAEFVAELGARLRVVASDRLEAVAIREAVNQRDSTVARLVRPASGQAAHVGLVRALDARGRAIAEAPFDFAGGTEANAVLQAPLEARNDIVRLEIADARSAGAVHLLDAGSQRRKVALVSGETADTAQPLVSGAYFVAKALNPYSNLVEVPRGGEAIRQALDGRPEVIVLVDVGTLPKLAADALTEFVRDGGVLVRFAGSGLASSSDTVLPVRLRKGGRVLGGALSWERPQVLASFAETGPFAGLPVPKDVSIERQVLAEPEPELNERTWASLTDGTPLVTAVRQGKGTLVLFHVTADTSWSNLPLSGIFVDMLRKILPLSLASGEKAERPNETANPRRILDGFGAFGSPPVTARPLPRSRVGTATAEHPPGFYGPPEATLAVNVADASTTLMRLDLGSAAVVPLDQTPPVDLRPWLLSAVVALFLLDGLAVLWLSGLLRRAGTVAGAAAAVLIALALATAPDAFAQTSQPPAAQPQGRPGAPPRKDDIEASLRARLAYVVTGNRQVDETSQLGLASLSRAMGNRTSFEPAAPMGLEPGKDELVFYSLIYWPITTDQPMPSDAALRAIDQFMKNGGTVIFDTRDASALRASGSVPPETRRLRQMLASLDIPELEQVPRDHVLTKTFYLLERIVGRYAQGETWLETMPRTAAEEKRPARAGDRVSPIIITSNDLAAAWAVDRTGQPLFPMVPGEPRQREMALRAGVNLVMYAMTGNYKADQVHVPALLERLGQ